MERPSVGLVLSTPSTSVLLEELPDVGAEKTSCLADLRAW